MEIVELSLSYFTWTVVIFGGRSFRPEKAKKLKGVFLGNKKGPNLMIRPFESW